jgi:hypothetical protein
MATETSALFVDEIVSLGQEGTDECPFDEGQTSPKLLAWLGDNPPQHLICTRFVHELCASFRRDTVTASEYPHLWKRTANASQRYRLQHHGASRRQDRSPKGV